MEPDIYWSLIRSQLVELVKQIDQDAAKEGPQKTDKLMHLRQIVSRITTASASDSMELDKRGALSNVSRNSEHYRIKMHLADDVLTSISILCIAAEDPERSAQGRKFLRAVMIHNTVEKWTWITATKLLLDVRKVLADNGGGPAGFLREECGSLFDFFFGSSVDGDDADVNSEESKFFIDSTARLLGITLECLHECPNDDEASMTALFSSNLNVSSDESASSGTTTDNDQFDKHPLTLAQFLNNTLDSKYKCVRELTYEIIGLAAAKAPGHFAEPAASVFSRASAKDPDHALRAATAALGWESVQKGGASALAASLPDLGDSLFLDGHLKSTGWLRSIAVAVSSLSWSSSPLEDRQEVALSLMKTQLHIQASGSRAGRIFDRLVATASTEAVADALIGAAERGTKQILADAQFDLENILCGTAPPCELRDVVEAVASALLLASQRSSRRLSGDSAYNNVPAEAFARLWQHVSNIIEEDLARTDQQGYAAVVVQWLLRKCISQTTNEMYVPEILEPFESPEISSEISGKPDSSNLDARNANMDKAVEEVESSGDEFGG